MKKKIYLIILLCSMLISGGGWIISYQSKITWLDMDTDGIYISVKSDNREEILRPWFDIENDIYYFFLPAFADKKDIYINKSLNGVTIDDTVVKSGNRFAWSADREYKINTGVASYNVRFMKSENLPAFFMHTDSGDMEYIHEDKSNAEKGFLTVINADGHLHYSGVLDKISGRGHTTWDGYKRPYSITLHDKASLCGLETGKKWSLLALYFEQDKIHSKIIYDLARELKIPYSPECTWVDLYCNGQYVGLYLLTEARTIASGRIEITDLEKQNEQVNSKEFLDKANVVKNGDIQGYEIIDPENYSGGYLVEKVLPGRIDEESNAYFTLSSGYSFVIESPQHASLNQVEYISDFFQNIESILEQWDSEYQNYIDMESFARQFLLDKIVMEADAMRMSTYFYKDQNNDVLFAGPVWDYDRAMGEIFTDYTEPIEGDPNGMEIWYMPLYHNYDFYNTVMSEYIRILPYLEKVLTEDIDHYAEFISASVKMDSVLMRAYASGNETVSYTQYDSYIKYLKFFLANRLNYLNSIWDIPDISFNPVIFSDEYHKVIFKDESGAVVEIREVPDGTFIETFPLCNGREVINWQINDGKTYSSKIPVFEDTVLSAY